MVASKDVSVPKNVPANVRAEMKRISDLLYAREAFGPSVQQWNRYRDPKLPRAESIMNSCLTLETAKGRKGDWGKLLSTAGLEYPPRVVAQAADRALRSDEKPHLHRTYCTDPLPEGLPVREVVRELRAWCVRRHAYVPARQIVAYMVR